MRVTVIFICLMQGVTALPVSDTLLKSYDKRVVPTPSLGIPVNVSVDVTLDHIIDLKEKHQHIHTSLWFRLKWNDVNMVWNASTGSEFENVNQILFQTSDVWTPDIVVYNEIGLETGRNPEDFSIQAQPNGDMRWGYPRSIITACPLDSKNFPYDHQICNITVGSWSQTVDRVDIYSEKTNGDLTEFKDKGEWKVTQFSVTRHVTKYDCCPFPYTTLNFNIVLERSSTFYMFNLVFPCILISLVNVFGFLLPVPSGERISLNITAFLGLVVFMIIVGEIMPPQADVIPNISIYFGVSLTLIAVANLLNVFIVHLHFRGTHGAVIPSFVHRYLVHRLGRLLGYKKLISHARVQEGNETLRDMAERVTSGGLANPGGRRPSINPEDEFGSSSAYLSIQKQGRFGMYPDDDAIAPGDRMPQPCFVDTVKASPIDPLPDNKHSDSGRSSSISLVGLPSTSLPRVLPSRAKTKVRRSKSTEWKVLAMILDRLIFIVLLFITLINNLIVLLNGL